QIGFVEHDPIDPNLPVANFNPVAGQPDDPLDVLSAAVAWIMKHHDVAALWLLEVVAELVDDQVLPLVQGRHHAVALDPVAARRRVDDPEDEQGQKQSLDDLADDDACRRRNTLLPGRNGRGNLARQTLLSGFL